jgi:hypothetical protein
MNSPSVSRRAFQANFWNAVARCALKRVSIQGEKSMRKIILALAALAAVGIAMPVVSNSASAETVVIKKSRHHDWHPWRHHRERVVIREHRRHHHGEAVIVR